MNNFNNKIVEEYLKIIFEAEEKVGESGSAKVEIDPELENEISAETYKKISKYEKSIEKGVTSIDDLLEKLKEVASILKNSENTANTANTTNTTGKTNKTDKTDKTGKTGSATDGDASSDGSPSTTADGGGDTGTT